MTTFVFTAGVPLLLCDRNGHPWLQPRCTAAMARVVDNGCDRAVAPWPRPNSGMRTRFAPMAVVPGTWPQLECRRSPKCLA